MSLVSAPRALAFVDHTVPDTGRMAWLADQSFARPHLQAFGRVAAEVSRDYRGRWERDRGAANAWLRDASRILTGAPRIIRELRDLDDIDRTAQWLADTCSDPARPEPITTDARLDAFRLRHGLPPVAGAEGGPRLARARDWHYWRRVLRREVARWWDQVMRHLGRVHKRRQIYCADMIVRWQAQRRAANLELLATLWAESDAGDSVNLLDIYHASLANPALRRAELLARIRGFERYADAHGHPALFVTLTAPSSYHARHAKSGEAIAQWNGATPRDVQRYLSRVWARIRARLAREQVTVYGFRVAEPHHDGCPHWHFLLFHKPAERAALEAAIRDHALAEDGGERGAGANRVKFERIDKAKGTATGYVIKYVAKSIDGHGVGEDLHGGGAEAAADRITAWARTWGIRQFQQIGGPAVGLSLIHI